MAAAAHDLISGAIEGFASAILLDLFGVTLRIFHSFIVSVLGPAMDDANDPARDNPAVGMGLAVQKAETINRRFLVLALNKTIHQCYRDCSDLLML